MKKKSKRISIGGVIFLATLAIVLVAWSFLEFQMYLFRERLIMLPVVIAAAVLAWQSWNVTI